MGNGIITRRGYGDSVLSLSGIVTDGLLLYVDAGNPNSYPGSGSTWFDLQNNFDGTLLNGVSYSSNNGGILTFDGSNDWVEFDNFASTYNGLNNFSATIWVKPDFIDQSGRGDVLMSAHAGTSNNLRWQIDNNYIFCADITDGGDTTYSHSTITTGTWHHYAITVDDSSNIIRVYLDGVQIDTDGYGGSLKSSGTTTRFSFGQEWDSSPSEFFKGAMSNAQIYDKVLSVEEIQQNFDYFKNRFGL